MNQELVDLFTAPRRIRGIQQAGDAAVTYVIVDAIKGHPVDGDECISVLIGAMRAIAGRRGDEGDDDPA